MACPPTTPSGVVSVKATATTATATANATRSVTINAQHPTSLTRPTATLGYPTAFSTNLIDQTTRNGIRGARLSLMHTPLTGGTATKVAALSTSTGGGTLHILVRQDGEDTSHN